MKNIFLALFLCAGLISAPLFAHASMPEPVSNAYKAIYDGKPYKMTLSNKTGVDLFGMKIDTAVKGTGYQDSDGDIEGKITMTVSFEDPNKKGSAEKFSLPMEYKIFPDSDTIYFKFKKLPKSSSSSALDGVKANTWYVQRDAENLEALTGSGVLAGENFISANEKYPAIVFTEKGSTKKEYVYAYSINESMLPAFLAEKARLDGEVIDAAEAGSSAGMFSEAAGTMRINKKTGLPSGMTMSVNSEMLTVQTAVTYKFGGSKEIAPVKGAISSDVVDGLFGGM